MPLGRIHARPSCTVAHGPRPQRRLGPCAQRTRPTACRAGLGLRGPRWRGAARVRTPERSPLSGRSSRRGWLWCYHGGGGAKDSARAPTAERPPAGHVGGGDSSPELLVDGKGGKTGTAAAFSDEVGAPVAGGYCVRVERERKLRLKRTRRKGGKGGARGSAHRGGVRGGGALGQRRGRLRTWETARSGRACARQGEATARLGQRRGAVGMALPVGTFMAWRGRVRGAAQARGSHAATVC
jgi:hypothetical protein